MRFETERTRRRGHPDSATDALARGLGWFSIGLGLTELFGARSLTRALGMEGQETLVRAYGVREIATGIGILASEDPTPWIWGRVAGDALDLATLATQLKGGNRERENIGIAIGAVAGVTALDILCAQTLSQESATPLAPSRDYSDRSGLPRSPDAMRGAALGSVHIPDDYKTPESLRPYPLH
ncbi:cyclase dehydrase [Salinarimonas soli]|uniref:Cyclase dehydrase n=1 Tax=Salinarimonas soli TaxID=1638099 RepID=A0A5B2VIZ1_9HYPH|nr:cyclase dehydrase [Salinarimonas soli]KAA2238167.1 cyclase dehydrase [Salinarimonas soli]